MSDGLFGDIQVSDRVQFASRDTSPGRAFEETVRFVLELGGYNIKRQADVGKRFGLTRHIVDFVARRADREVLVSAKWQGVSGTGEDKVPYEVITLIEALNNGTYAGAYVVMGGPGWTNGKRDFYVNGGLNGRVTGAGKVKCLTLDAFLDKAYRSDL